MYFTQRLIRARKMIIWTWVVAPSSHGKSNQRPHILMIITTMRMMMIWTISVIMIQTICMISTLKCGQVVNDVLAVACSWRPNLSDLSQIAAWTCLVCYQKANIPRFHCAFGDAFVLFQCQQCGFCFDLASTTWLSKLVRQGEVVWIFTRQGHISQVSQRALTQCSGEWLRDGQGKAMIGLGPGKKQS